MISTIAEIDTNFIGNEISSLLAICLDIETPEQTKIVLRKELREIKTEIDKIIAEYY